MTRLAAVGLILGLLPLAVEAQQETYLSGDGTEYLRVEGELVNLVSRGDATHAVGADMEVTGDERLTFNRDCSVTSSLLGHGTWSQSGGGVLATFRRAHIDLPRQEFYSTPNACKS